MAAPPVYTVEKVRHSYAGLTVLAIDHLEIMAGTITGLFGPNGSGKSTLLKLLAFAESPFQGEIRFKGRAEKPYSRQIQSTVTLLTQEPYLLNRTVFDNVAYGLKIRKKTKGIKTAVKEALNLVGLDFDTFAHRGRRELSGGEAQRVAMAARLVLEPEVLLLDEPTASVDVESAGLIRDAALQTRSRMGTTLVVASHDRSWLYDVSDRQLHVFGGKVFSTVTQNIIPGPWTPCGQDSRAAYVVKTLENGREIRAVRPDIPAITTAKTTDKTAFIRQKNIHINPAPTLAKDCMNRLEGVVSRMFLEKKTTQVIVTVTVHGLELNLKFPPDTASSLGLFPGKPISLAFDAHDIQWI